MGTTHKWVAALGAGDMDSSASYDSGVAPHGAATATVTCASAVATDTVTVNGLTYTAVAGAKANDTEFSIDTSDTATATDLADSITNDTRTGTDVPSIDQTAGGASAVVTITAGTQGVAGNSILLSSSNGTRLAVSDANLVAPVAWATDDTFRMDDSSSVSISTNQDIMSDVTILRWAIHESYTGDMGSSAVRCDLAVTHLDHSGSGTLWYDGVGGAVVVNSNNNANAADVNGTITELYVLRGMVTAAPTNVLILAASMGFNANLTLNSGGNVVSRVIVGLGARMTLNRRINEDGEVVSVGELIDNTTMGTSYNPTDEPSVYILGGTYVIKPAGGGVAGSPVQFHIQRGTLDLIGATGPGTGYIFIGPSVNVIESEVATATESTSIDLRKPFP